jgi:hypothetical protein
MGISGDFLSFPVLPMTIEEMREGRDMSLKIRRRADGGMADRWLSLSHDE